MNNIIFSIVIPATVSFIVSVITFKYKIRFKELHIERAKVIKTLWSKINNVSETLIEDKQEENLQKSEGKRYLPLTSLNEIQKMKTYFNENSIYFNNRIVNEFNSILNKFQKNSSQTDINIVDLRNNLEILKKPLEKEFRKLLGV